TTRAPRDGGAFGIRERLSHPVYDDFAPLVHVPVHADGQHAFRVSQERIGAGIQDGNALFQCTCEADALVAGSELHGPETSLKQWRPRFDVPFLLLARDGPGTTQVPPRRHEVGDVVVENALMLALLVRARVLPFDGERTRQPGRVGADAPPRAGDVHALREFRPEQAAAAEA